MFGPSSGVLVGWSGLVLCVVLGAAFATGSSALVGARWALGAALVATLIWCVMLRPQIVIQAPEQLVLRNMISTWQVPLAGVEQVVIRALTSVHTAEGKYDAVAVGKPRKRRSTGRFLGLGPMPGTPPRVPEVASRPRTPADRAEVVTTLILGAAEAARLAGHEPTPVRRIWAVPELAAIGSLAIALAVTLVL